MAPKKEKSEVTEKTFYIYDYANNLATREKRIYSPYNVKTKGRLPTEDAYDDPDYVVFKDGQYTAKLDELGPVLFEQQLEWLSYYNTVGGILSKGHPELGQERINGSKYRNDGIHIVREELLNAPTPVKEVVKEVEVQSIPRIIAESMNVAQLRDLSREWRAELPEDIMEKGDSEAIKKYIIDILEQGGHIK